MSYSGVFRRGTVMKHVGGSDHLHIIMNDPIFCPVLGYEGVLMAAVTSLKPGLPHDSSCILHPADHRFIKHDSFIHYADSEVFRAPGVQQGIDCGDLRPHDEISIEVFRRIRDGFYVDAPNHGRRVSRFIRQRLEPEFQFI